MAGLWVEPRIDCRDRLTLLLDGDLSGDECQRLERLVEQRLDTGLEVRLDLSSLRYAGPDGAATLGRLRRRGAALVNGTELVMSLIP